jgi:serine/threonine-protein kinase
MRPVLGIAMPRSALSTIDAAQSYEVVRRLAVGGMAELFLANQLGPEGFRRPVVLKRILPGFADHPDYVALFLNEARLAATLCHPNIAHVYELFQTDGGYAFSMEYVRGRTVHELIEAASARGRRLPDGFAVGVAARVCDALDYAYGGLAADDQPLGVIHRDVSPTNVIVSRDGQVKLVDFGIAESIQAAVAETGSQSLRGKYRYMSPEQVLAEPLDNRSDIFAVGTLLWEMTVGLPLFRRPSDVETLQAVVEEPIPAPSSVRADYPPPLETVVMRALSRDRDQRFANAGELSRALGEVAAQLGWRSGSPELAAVVRELRKRPDTEPERAVTPVLDLLPLPEVAAPTPEPGRSRRLSWLVAAAVIAAAALLYLLG